MAAESRCPCWRACISAVLSLTIIFPPQFLLQLQPSSDPQAGSVGIRLPDSNPKQGPRHTHADFFKGTSGKVGNFSVAFNDCTIPIAGLPITITRTYDTRAAGTSGDFGYGWRLAIADIRLEKTANLGKFWFQQGDFTNFLGAFSMVEGKSHKITITFPDGKVYKFQGSITPGKQFASAIDGGTYTFTPIQPTLGKLTVVGSNDIFVNGAPDEQNTFVPCTLQDFSGNIFNPTTFQLVTQEGMTYVIDQFNGLQSMTDLNGNTITVTPNGLISSTGKSVVFERDGANRITKITDCAGNPMYYGYDGSGNLISFTDRESNTTQFTFDNTHKLISIIDPRGITPATNQYDDSGRLQSTTDAFGHSIVYNHDLAGRVETINDRNGNPTTYAYDNDGNVLTKIDALGAETDYTFDLNDNQLTMTDPLKHVWKKDYDDFNNVLHDIDPLGNTTTYSYDNTRHVLTVKDPNGNITKNDYDAHNNLQAVTDPLGNVTKYGYDYTFNPAGDPVSMIDANGKLWQYGNDNYGNRTSVTDPDNHVIQYQFDANNNRTQTKTTRMNGNTVETLFTNTVFDNMGRPTLITYSDGKTTQTQYNSIGKVFIFKNELGYPTQYDYDGQGRSQKTTFADGTTTSATYDNENNCLTSTDQNGHITNYKYDVVNQLKKTTFADGTFTSTDYDLVGRVMDTTDQRGNVTRYDYFDNNRQKTITDALTHQTSYTYDSNGNQKTMLDANNHMTTYSYDADNRLTKTTFDDGSYTETQYDSLGRKQYFWDQARKQTQYGYDNESRLTTVTDALGNITQYGYDEVGEELSQTDANNHVTGFAYDMRGRRVKRTLPLGMSETYHYDDAGNMDSRIDSNGRTTQYSYDKLNRLLTKTPDPAFQAVPIVYEYWPTGTRKSMMDASGQTQYSYDNLDRLLTKQTPEGTLTYQYDAAGNISTVRSSNSNGVSNDYSYDALNRLSTVLDNRHNATTTYGYDNVGNLLNYRYPNGVQTNLNYDNLNRLLTIGSANGQAISSYGYTLGVAGNRLNVLELSNRLVKYDYDDLYRLKTETITGDPASANNGSINYQYDFVGNRLSRTSGIATVPPSSNSFDQNDRLNTDQYDDNGNTTASSGNVYAYDFENQIIRVNNGAITVVYDGDGNRVSKTVNGVTTTYLVDTNNLTGYAQVIEESQNSIIRRVYTYGNHLISQDQLLNGAWTQSFYGYDGGGSVRFLSNYTGVVTDKYEFDAFGILMSIVGNTPNNYLYCGEQFDSDLGLYFLRARYMNPQSGRYWSADTFEGVNTEPGSLHKYLYVGANAVNRCDPSGHFNLLNVAVAVVIIVGLAIIAQGAYYRLNALPGGSRGNPSTGPDITYSLIELQDRVRYNLWQRPFLEREKQLSLIGDQNWDINELHDHTLYTQQFPLDASGHSSCTNVTMFGRVVDMDEANYYLFGIMCRLDGITVGGMQSEMSGWKRFKYKHGPTEDDYWAAYRGWSQDYSTDSSGANPPILPAPVYLRRLSYRWADYNYGDGSAEPIQENLDDARPAF